MGQGLHDLIYVRVRGPQSSKQIGKEASRVIVPRLKREPGNGASARGQPVAEQGGFAEPGGGRKKDQGLIQALLQSLDQVRTIHQMWTRARKVKFGGKQGVGR